MNWVDLVIIMLVLFSAMLAFSRGLIRELLGIGSWVGAGLISVWVFPLVRTRFHSWISESDVADIGALGVVFIFSLFFLSLLASMIGGVVRNSMLGGLDRTFGFVFGLVRAAVILAIAYIIGGFLVPFDHWPDAMREARSMPYIYRGAVAAVSLLPDGYRPSVSLPPGGRDTSAADLLRLVPQGRALAKP